MSDLMGDTLKRLDETFGQRAKKRVFSFRRGPIREVRTFDSWDEMVKALREEVMAGRIVTGVCWRME